MKCATFVIAKTTNEIYGVKVRSLAKHSEVIGVAAVYLTAFEYLQAHRSVGVIG